VIRISLEKFKTNEPKQDGIRDLSSNTSQDDAEELRLSSFEDGYRAGWDDAQKTTAESQQKLSQELVQNIQDIGFAQEEARQHVLKAIEPVLQEIVSKVLPQASQQTLLPLIIENLIKLLKDRSEVPIVLAVTPESQNAVATALGEDLKADVMVEGDPVIGPNQARITGATKTVELDLGGTISDIQSMLQDFFKLENGGQTHG